MKNDGKGQVILLVGLPGAGKSTYLKRRGIQALSSDAIRLILLDDETDQSQQPRVFSTLRFLLSQSGCLQSKRTSVCADRPARHASVASSCTTLSQPSCPTVIK